MKRIYRNASIIGVVLLAALNLAAQPQRRPEGKKGDPEKRVQMHKTMMYGSIDNLSAEQKSQMEAVFEQYKPEMKALREEGKSKTEADREAIKKEMKPKADAIKSKIDADISKILTESQWKQYEAYQKKMKEERGKQPNGPQDRQSPPRG